MRRSAILLAGTAAMLAAPVAAPVAAQVTDFRLPPGPTPTPRVVGPLPDTPVPRASATPTPTPTATAAPPAPAAAPPAGAPTVNIPAPTATVRPRAAAPSRRGAPTPLPSPTAGAAPLAPPTPAAPAPTATASAATGPAVVAPAPSATEAPRRSWWPWIALVFALAAAAAAALVWLRRKVGPLGPVVVPEIERPRVPAAPLAEPAAPTPAPEPEPESRPESEPAEAHPLHIAIELRKLSLTLMNATLGYRLTLTNAGAEPLRDLAIAADLIGAHGSLPREAQLAGPVTELPIHHRLAGLAPGESGDVAGELRVPLSELRTIAQGRAQLFVPLARFRIASDGQEPRCFTLVAGQPSPSGNGAIQPVRLDHGPRIYDGLAGRAF